MRATTGRDPARTSGSVGSRPSSFFFEVKEVAWLIPASRPISAAARSSALHLSMIAFGVSEPEVCASENLLAFIDFRCCQPKEKWQGKL
ncbi:hypothetical protein [Rhabdaerophilum sp. SD176]|uniref:hypothetical protein n=1 Tax=Rhabdaerophilum sp. SD176 TaxID=2983548 RepID=UPI0024DFFFC7|nr:hypothetical protein [Rhabdaerophilum sp. SD176]